MMLPLIDKVKETAFLSVSSSAESSWMVYLRDVTYHDRAREPYQV